MPKDRSEDSSPKGQERKPYVAPKIFSDDLFESKGLACLKVNTMGPLDCSNMLPGASRTS